MRSRVVRPCLISICAVCAVMILFFAAFSTPIADDWGFLLSTERSNIWNIIYECMQHTGRVGQWLTIFVGMKIFGMNAVNIMPIFTFVALSIAGGVIIKFTKILNNYLECFLCSTSICATFIFMLPSLFDSFLWYDSNASYMMSILAMMILGILLYAATNKNSKRKMLITILLLVCAFISQLFSEPTSIMSILFMAIFCFYFIKKSGIKDRRSLIYISTLAIMILGFFVLYFSPGSIARRQLENSGFDIYHVLVESLRGYVYIAKGLNLVNISLAIIVSLLLSMVVRRSFFSKKTFLLMLFCFIACTYGVFAINNYSQEAMPYRILTLPALATTLMIMFSLCYVFSKIQKKYNFKNRFMQVAVTLAVCILLVIGNVPTLSELALRKFFVNYRDEYVKSQVANSAKNIEIPKLPLKLTGNAEDLYYYIDTTTGETKMIWVADSYIEYIGADKSKCILVDLAEY